MVADYDQVFLNPCLDTNFVSINAKTLDPFVYLVGDDPQVDAHEEFTITTGPRAGTHDLCGALSYTVTYDTSVSVTDSTRPLSYEEDSVAFTFKVQSDDPTLRGETKPYSLAVEFANYP